jgi:diamine N-acetyltransferase
MFYKTDRISLRQVEPSDAQLIYKWENDTSVWNVSDTIAPYSHYQIEQFILNSSDIYTSKQIRLMIDCIDNQEPFAIGAIDIYDFDPQHHRAGVGIILEASQRQKGYANEALDLLEKYCFTFLGLHQLYCFIAAQNSQSISLFTKRGYILSGTRKDWLLLDGKWTDQLHFQLINPKTLIQD